MLVNSERFGSQLASEFSASASTSLDHNVVLMKNHGFTTVGTSIKQAVYQAVYTHVNASVQTNAIMLRNAHLGTSYQEPSLGGENSEQAGGDLTYLDGEQVLGSLKMSAATQDRPWGLWEREVEVCPLYVSDAKLAKGATSRNG
jgi:hypothetical protein